MKKIGIALIAMIMATVFIVGCTVTPQNPTVPTTQTQTTEAEATTTMNTTVAQATTTAVPTTTVAKTEPQEIVTVPISPQKPEPKPEIEPEKPTRPSRPASTDDEQETKPLDPKYKYIAITLDDGPHWSLTYKFADKLAQYGGNATFFVVGNRVSGEQAKAMKYAYDLGNEIGVHCYTHEYYYSSCSEKKFREELDKTAKVIEKYTGEYPLVMRPPGGMITQKRIKSSGFAVINWNVDSADWQNVFQGEAGRKRIVNNVISKVDEGDIILMHEIYEDSYKAFCTILDKLYKKGYRFVTVSQLLGLNEGNVGNIYYGY